MATHTHIAPAPAPAPPPMSRRRLMSAVTTAALAGTALAVAAPIAASAATTGDDAELLRLCAAFEANIRRQNGLWRWHVWGQGGSLQGPNYIEDDDEREAANGVLDMLIAGLVDDMLEHPPTTLAGFQALARCLLLSSGDMRDVVAGDKENFHLSGFTCVEWNIVISLLSGLTVDPITDATCMDAPAWFVSDAVGVA